MLSKYEKALEYEIFEKGEYSFLEPFWSQINIVFDVGGNIGLFSKYCVEKIINNGGKIPEIHFFEPVDFHIMKAKKILEKWSENIVFNQLALDVNNGEKEFFVNTEKTMQSGFFDDNFLNKNGKKTIVQTIKLEDYLETENIEKIDLMKIDIEGAEFDLLESRDEEVLDKIGVLALELHFLYEEKTMKWKNIEKKLGKSFKNRKSFRNPYSEKLSYELWW